MEVEDVAESLTTELSYFGVELPPKAVAKQCAEIKEKCNVTIEEFCEQWITFSFKPPNTQGIPLSLENLDAFERYLASEAQKKKVKGKLANSPINSPKVDPVLNYYNDSPSQKTQTPKRARDDDDVDYSAKRPKEIPSSKKSLYGVKEEILSQSTPEQDEIAAYCVNFADRKDALEVVSSYGIQILKETSTFRRKGLDKIIIKQIYEEEMFKHDTMMYHDTKMRKMSCLNYKIETIGKYLIDKHKLSAPEHLISLPYLPETATVYGRVMKNNKGKMDKSTILLETSSAFGEGDTVHIDLYKVNSAVLFPGQIVALSAAKGRQNTITATCVYSDAMLELPKDIPELATSGPMQVVIAAGPYTMSNNLSYEPLKELMKYVHEHNPHVLILTGPFLDPSHETITKETFTISYETHFEVLIVDIMDKLKEKMCDTKIVIVSSSKDLHHCNVYPTPPYHLEEKYQNLHFVGDPSVIDINGVIIGATSTDVLFHVNKEALFIKSKEQATSRMNSLVNSIISQQSFYPLYPPGEDICLDVNLLKKHGQWSETPHIMILPSKLRYFVKDIDGCVVINPEKLSTGCSGGTFARMEIYPNQTTQSIADKVVCEVLKI